MDDGPDAGGVAETFCAWACWVAARCGEPGGVSGPTRSGLDYWAGHPCRRWVLVSAGLPDIFLTDAEGVFAEQASESVPLTALQACATRERAGSQGKP